MGDKCNVMAYQPPGSSPFNARDAHFTPQAKLANQYDPYGDDEEEEEYSDEEEEDEVPWYARSDIRWIIAAIVALLVVALLFMRSLNGGGEPAPSPTPAPQLARAVPTPAPVWTAPTSPPTLPPTTTVNPLVPKEKMHDNNICQDTEEEYGSLCYRKCSLLTNGTHPIRTSSWTCCSNHPCGISNTDGNLGKKVICEGYDVSGSFTCPTQPGACLVNEELYLGVCYEKCSQLTKGQYPTRVGPATCCVTSGIGCFDIRQDATSSNFLAGGGNGDGDGATPSMPHSPLTNLTEAGGVGETTPYPSWGPGTGGVIGTGSQCEADEELYAGLCYKTCSILTNGQYPIRTSTWSCCQSHPCGTNQKATLGNKVVCDGFGVGGQGALQLLGSPCPHKPKACNSTQDEILGICYAACSLLTKGEFPHRLTANTCCKEAGFSPCLDPSKLSMSSGYNTGR